MLTGKEQDHKICSTYTQWEKGGNIVIVQKI